MALSEEADRVTAMLTEHAELTKLKSDTANRVLRAYAIVLIACIKHFQSLGYEPTHPSLYECYHPPAIIGSFREL